MRQSKFLIIVITFVLLLAVAAGCGEPSATPKPTPTPRPTPTLLPQIGDKVTSGSIQASVLWVEETPSISDGDITIEADEGFTILPVTVELENLGGTSVTLTLAPESTTVRDAEQQYLLACVGGLSDGLSRLLYGSSGKMSVSPLDESYKLTGDFTNDVWTIMLMPGSSIEILLIFIVPIGSSGLKFSLPDFTPIRLED